MSYHEGMKPCISEATTLPGTFADDVDAYADGGCHAMEVWLTKLETHLETHSAADTRKLLEDRQMTLAAASYQGGLLLSQGEQRKAHYDHFSRRLDLCQPFGIPTLLVVADFVEQGGRDRLERAVVSLKQAAQWAAAFDVRLALEFRGSATFCSSLDTALALVAAVRRAERRRQPRRLPLLHRAEQVRGPGPADAATTWPSCRCATWPACRASWRPTPTASCPARATFGSEPIFGSCAASATTAGCRWN